MSIFELLLLAMALGTVIAFVTIVIGMLRRQWIFVRQLLGSLLFVWILYLTVGAIIAISTPQRIVAIGSERCFDEMCFSVTGFRRAPRIEGGGSVTLAHGIFYILDVRVSSKSLGRSQHETGRKAMLIDAGGHVYDLSAEGMRALRNVEGPSPSLDSDLQPGESVLAKLVFDLPKDVKRPVFTLGSSLLIYPPRIVIADDMHFLHKPTIVPLD
jgi:hypothetical protein